MPYTAAAKDLMLDALRGTNPAAPITHVGALDADAGKAVTAAAASDTFTSNAHGYANGDLVVLSALTGGNGLAAGRPYFVINTAANTFKLALKPGGAAVDVISDLTAGTVTRLVELTGGAPAYARKAIAYNAPDGGTMDDSTNGAVIDVPPGATVDYIGYYSAVAAGTLLAISPVTPETYAGQGTYTVTDSDLDLNAA
jgi:hypothetical protein